MILCCLLENKFTSLTFVINIIVIYFERNLDAVNLQRFVRLTKEMEGFWGMMKELDSCREWMIGYLKQKMSGNEQVMSVLD